MHLLDPRISEVLPLEGEPENPEDKFTVAITGRSRVVVHVPFNLAQIVSAFLKKGVNKGLVEVTGTVRSTLVSRARRLARETRSTCVVGRRPPSAKKGCWLRGLDRRSHARTISMD